VLDPRPHARDLLRVDQDPGDVLCQLGTGLVSIDYRCDNEKKKLLSWCNILVSLRS
jgi:hypothetical protein